MIAAIVAGGRGERLGPLTDRIPKPLLKISGKPILEHQINLLQQYGITDIYILIGYLGQQIKDYFGDGMSFGVSIEYFQEENPLGTSGCLNVLRDKIQDDFLVVYGDILFDFTLDDLTSFHKEKGGVGTLVVHPNDHPYDSDLVTMDENHRIISFLPKNNKPQYYGNLVNAAFFCLSPIVLNHIPEGMPSNFEKDVFPKMLGNSSALYGYKTAEYIKDAGTFDRLEKIKKDFLSGKVLRNSKKYKRPAIFIDRDGTLIRKVNLLHKDSDLELFSFSASAVRKINNSDFLSILVTNQPVVARNLCDVSAIIRIHNRLETLLGREGIYLDEIYFCPHHPNKGFPEENKVFKIDCDCRKPKIGMIKRAVKEYNIDIESSWFIGDTSTDIKTGKNARMKTILVRTGEGGKDNKFDVSPEYVVDNIEDAVNIILFE